MRAAGKPPSAYALEAVSKLFLPHMHRCRSLCLVSDEQTADFPLLVPESPFRGLQHVMFDWSPALDVSWDRLDPQDSVKAEASMLSLITSFRTPLKSLGIKGLIETQGNFGIIDVQALTQLEINVQSNGQVLQLLQRCPSLKHLNWTVHETEETAENYPDHIDFNNLVSLKIAGSLLPDKLCTIAAPRLEQVQFLPETSYAHLPFDILRANHPLLPSLTRVHLSLYRNAELLSFLRRHPGITQCVIYMPQLSEDDDVASIRGLLDSFLPDGRHGCCSGLQRLLLIVGEMKPARWEEVGPSVELVLDELPELCIDLCIYHWLDKKPVSFCQKLGPRISVNQGSQKELGKTWRDAWGNYSLW